MNVMSGNYTNLLPGKDWTFLFTLRKVKNAAQKM